MSSMAAGLVAGTMMAGTAVKAYGDYQAAGAKEKQAENAQDMMMRRRQVALAVASRNVEASRRDMREKIRVQQAAAKEAAGRRRLAFGSAGDIGGTAFEFLASKAAQDEMNLARIKYSSKVRTQNIRYAGDVAAWQYAAQATAYGNTARAIAKGKKLQALGTLLQGGAQSVSSYGSMGGFEESGGK